MCCNKLESMSGSINTLLLLLAVVGCASAEWQKFSTGYYSVHPEKRSWHDAWLACTTEGGHLVIINSPREAEIVKPLLASLPRASVSNWDFSHVGVSALYHKPHYVTVFGQPLASTNFQWAPGEPNDYDGKEACGTVTRTGLLNDSPCSHPFPFICEKK